MNNSTPNGDRFCLSAEGDVYLGVPLAGVPDVHDLIISGQLEKALSVSASKGGGDRDGVRGDNRIPPIPQILLKSKTWSGHPIRKRLTFRGLKISIENPAGTYRTGKDPDGNEWRSLLHFDYGYIRGTTGVDKDHVDCFMGPEPNAPKVYVIHQRNVKTGKYDEDKCMLGWRSREQAIEDYLKNYDRRDMFMSCTTMTFDKFKPKVLATANKPQMIKAKIKTHLRHTKSGKITTVREHQDSRTKKGKSRKIKGMSFVKVGAMPTGSIKVPGTKITKAGDIAAIFKSMRDDAREKYWVVGTDKDDKLISVELHSMGGITDSTVDPRVILSVLRANKAKKYWGIHNHPSGSPNPSRDDYAITDRIKAFAKKFGIEHQGDVIIHGGKLTFTTFEPYIDRAKDDYVPTQKRSWVEHPISEIKVTSRESAPSGMPDMAVTSAQDAARLGKWIQAEHGKGVWGITLNGQNNVTGFFLLGDNHLNLSATQTKYSKALMKHMLDTGSVNCITVGSHPSARDAHAYRETAEKYFKPSGYQLLDAVFETGQGYYSARGMTYTGVQKSIIIMGRTKAGAR